MAAWTGGRDQAPSQGMGLRIWICAGLLTIITLLSLAYTVSRAASYIVIYDSNADGRHEMRMRSFPAASGPGDARWWFMLGRPVFGSIAHLELAYRDLGPP